MGNYWSLSNIQKPNGQLDRTRDFLGITDRSEISCCQVIVPISIDVKLAIQSASNILGISSKNPYHNTVRSFEIWWDGTKKQLKIVLASHSPEDLKSFKIAFSQMYPNATYFNLNVITPEWYFPVISKEEDYKIFDVSTHHGHYSTIFDKSNAHCIITRIANTIQLAKYAWIQFVFAPYNFTPYLKSHNNQLNRRIKFVTSKKFRNWIDEIKESKPYENPENGMDFYNNYKTMQSDTAQKMQKSHVIMSIRGLLSSSSSTENNNSDSLESIPFDDIKSNYEHLTAYTYNISKFYNNAKPKRAGSPITISGAKRPFERQSLFELRLIPAAKKPFENAISNYFNTSKITGDYKTRKPLPFLVLNNDEMSLFVHLPDAVTTKNLQTSRNVSLPSKLTSKKGFNLGYLQESKVFSQYGKIVKSTDENCSVISTVDFSRHGYIVGGTGSGKTTLLRIIAKHLETSNLNGEFPNSFIYLDPKGDDSLKFIEQCDKQSINNHNVHFLDPIETDFSINPLELPKYPPNQRQETVSRYVGYFMEILKEWYNQQQSFVQMERIFRVLLFYMYQNNDAPTFLDMYDIIINIQEEQEKFLQIMFKALGMPDSEAMKQALTSIATLRPESFVPLLNRVEQFATDPILKKVFCVRHGTVKFEDLIKSGQYTIVRISSLHLAHHVQPLAIQAFVIKLWFTIQERAARIKNEENRNYVILALDEFQIVSDLKILPMILSQARSYRLGLLLAHQTTAQISDSLLEEITGNCGTQLAGRISGKDASKLANIWDPRFSKEITQQLASQEDFHWTIKMRAAPGEEQPTPLQFWLHNPPIINEDEQFLDDFVSEQKRLYGNNDDGNKIESSSFETDHDNSSILQQKQIEKNRWMRYITASLPEKEQWQIMIVLYRNNGIPLQLGQITESLKADQRDDISEILHDMVQQNILDVIDDENRNAKYILSEDTKKQYFIFDSSKIGTADDIPYLTKKATESYLQKGYFITISDQTVKKDEDRTDLIAYSYETDKAISVEIESASELASHPEAARKNMEKWSKMGFAAYHGWSTSNKIKEIMESQIEPEKRENVLVFVV